jgi:hypothetical protein
MLSLVEKHWIRSWIMEAISKYESVFDFTWSSMQELEEQVDKYFPEEKWPRDLLYMNILGSLPFKMLCEGWSKEELLKLFDEQIDDDIRLLEEFDSEA